MSEHVHGANLLPSSRRLSPSPCSQDTRPLRLTTLLGDGLLAECVHREGAIGEAYRLTVDVLASDALPAKALVGQPALLQLPTADSFSALRSFHGYITAAEPGGARGGVVRYVLTIAPWSTFLSLGRDSRSYRDMTVFDILDVVFGSHAGRGKLACAWRFEVADQGVYPKRSLSTQHQESDLAFAERLMLEEGLFYFFEHSGEPGSAAFGSHTMVIAEALYLLAMDEY
ncbi:phage late control D family protein [Massilia sp. H6]|uniref:phage late control D family protein n=1 Tax=Massilia sp. H6 TaxID=2970464 RepID=UPI0021673785|nr:phage late control D family protein [Massilia sp. H6]UVW29613.1 phage late control D family protein [Massilia sp. H6]